MPKHTEIELVALGSGNAFANGRDWSCMLLDRKILFDAPPTALPRLRELQVPLAGIEFIFISHFHADHVFGLPFLFLDMCFLTNRKKPLTIIGPVGIRETAERLMDQGFPNVRERFSSNMKINYIEVEPDSEHKVTGLSFNAVKMYHGDTPDIGYRLDYKGRIISYSGDTGPCEGLKRLVKGAQVVISEMSSLDGDFDSHMNLKNVKALRKTLPHDCLLLLTHLSPLSTEQKERIQQNPYGRIEPLEDMQRLKLGI
jgi:ribonuclease Z